MFRNFFRELFSLWYLAGDWMSAINRGPTYIYGNLESAVCWVDSAVFWFVCLALFNWFMAMRLSLSWRCVLFCSSAAVIRAAFACMPMLLLRFSLACFSHVYFIFCFVLNRCSCECVSARVCLWLFIQLAHISFISIRISMRHSTEP